ncbi:MAG: type II secretion system secretin GspD [Gammaproteobacteria bacterium]|nr:type II secretion system secretin GspD [Gammaproteobacteria bacterium]
MFVTRSHFVTRNKSGKHLPGILFFLLLLIAATPVWAKKVTLNMKGADIGAVISTVAEATGKNFIIDPRVKGKVTIISSKALDSKTLYQVFLAILEVHGFTAVPTGDVIKILPDADAKHSGMPSEGEGEEVVTRVLDIKNIAAARLVPILRPLVPPQGHLAAHAETNTLIIADRASNIDRLMRIIERIDEPSGAEIEVIQLENASAAEVVRILQSLDRNAKSKEPQAEQVTLVADERTNSILLGGEKSARLRIKSIVAHLDTPSEMTGNTHVIYLKYAKAKDLVAVLTGVGQSTAKSSTKGKKASSKSKTDFNIQADESANALVITGPPDIFRSLEAVIRKLDVRRAQVLIEAIITEVSATNTAELGIQWFADGSSKNLPIGVANLGEPSISSLGGAIAALPEGTSIGQAAIGTAGTGLTIGGIVGSFAKDSLTFGGLLKALSGNSGTNILSTPNIVTMDNQEAEIFVGQEVSVPTGSYTSTGTTSSPTNPFTTFKPKQVGVRLKVKPQINEGDAIKLEIEQTVDSITSGSAGTAGLVTSQRTVQTSVMVDDGKVVILGGLISDEENESATKIPLLGDIPLLGNLFKYKNKIKSKTNLMIFLRPTILRDAAVTTKISTGKYNFMRGLQMEARDLDDDEIKDIMPSSEELMKGASRIPPQSSAVEQE